jgi:hypothetical protein
MKFSRAYSAMLQAHDFEGGHVAEVHFGDGRSVRVSCASDGVVLIRMWGPNVEHGQNAIKLSMTARLTDKVVIESIWPQSARPPSPEAPPYYDQSGRAW